MDSSRVSLLHWMLFATYRFLIQLQVRAHDDDAQNQQRQPTLSQIFLAGAGCGLASTLLMTPIELIKIQQQKHQQLLHTAHEIGTQTSSPASASASARAVARHIYRTGGIRALYRGLSATIWRDVGGYGLYFYGHEGTLRLFSPMSAHPIPSHHHHHHREIMETLDRSIKVLRVCHLGRVAVRRTPVVKVPEAADVQDGPLEEVLVSTILPEDQDRTSKPVIFTIF